MNSTVHSLFSVLAMLVCAEWNVAALGQISIPQSNTGPAQPLLPASPQFVRQPAVSGTVDAQHSPNVQTILKPEYKLSVERRHSQLVLTRRNIRRLAVTDSTVCNYVQYSPTEIAVVGLELGTTDLMIWFDGQSVPAIYEVTVLRDENLEEQRRAYLGRLERRLGELFPNSNVYLVPVGNQVLVKGQAYDAEEADQIMQIVRSEVIRSFAQFAGNDGDNTLNGNGALGVAGGQNRFQNGGRQFDDIVVNMLQVPGEYNIKMRVVIAEISRSQLRDMGIDWNVFFNDGRHGIGASLGGATGTTLSGIFENGEISVLVKWLATNGTATLLAEPTIVCMSGHSASLLAGGEFAVPTIIGLGGGQTTSFRGVGTSMVVTPTVIDRDLIRMQIVPEFSSVDGNNSVNGIPGTTVKRVQTTVELREGQTLALGGLISRQTSTQINRIPFLGDLPFVGSRLFHSKNSSEDEVELLVLVTPEIVRPMEPDEVPPLPNYYVTHPNDHDLYKYGRSEGNPDANVYQVQPFGTGQNRGMPSGYSLQGAGMVPQFATPGSGITTMGNVPVQSGPPVMTPQPDVSVPPPAAAVRQFAAPQQYNAQPTAIPPAANPPSVNQPVLPPAPGNIQGNNLPQRQPASSHTYGGRFRSPFQQGGAIPAQPVSQPVRFGR